MTKDQIPMNDWIRAIYTKGSGITRGDTLQVAYDRNFFDFQKKRNLERDQHFLVAHFLLDNSKGISVKCLMLNTGGKFI